MSAVGDLAHRVERVLDKRANPYASLDGGTGGSFSVARFAPDLHLAVAVFTNTARPVDRIGLEIAESLVA